MMALIDTIMLFNKAYDMARPYGEGCERGLTLGDLARLLDGLPPIEPERKPGHWILGGYDDMYYVCDQCGYRRSDYYAKPKAKYCENCGADMREGEQE